jgi:uncharacterized RDD family membrane protein YckC
VQPEPPIVTGEAVALELRTAGLGSRGVAALIDLAAMVVALLPLAAIIGAIGSSADTATYATLAIVVDVGVLLGCPVALETLWQGRTLGKAAMGLRVVRDDGGPIRFRHALVRGLLGLFVERPGFSVGLAAVIPMLATRQGKRCGDVLAGTIVIQDRVPGGFDVPVPMPPPLAGWAASLDLAGVDDGLALRVRQFLGRAATLHPDSRSDIESRLVSDVVARVGQPPSGAPPWAVLAAVSAERRERGMRSLRATPADGPSRVTPPRPAGGEPVTPPPSPHSPGGFAPPA